MNCVNPKYINVAVLYIQHSNKVVIYSGGKMEDEQVTIKGKNFKIKRIGTSRRTAAARLYGNVITIKIPLHINREEAFRVFLNLKNRIIKDIEKHGPKKGKPKESVYYDGQEIALLGRALTIRINDGNTNYSRAHTENNNIMISLAAGLTEKQRKKHISSLARMAMSRQVLPDVKQRAKELNARHFNFIFNEVRIKNQTTRWGSYSTRTKNINISFRLLFAPPDVLDSVIIHELAHIKELNHSDNFWKLVIDAMPDYKEKRRWLNKNGDSLCALAPVKSTIDQQHKQEMVQQQKI